MRGVAMILMALDHTRDYLGVPGDPTNLATASVALFLTRWITHVCAPTFFLLTGVGARLAAARWTIGHLSRFLLTRGALLIALETVVLRCFAYQFNADFRVTMLLVLWALGWSMIVLAALVPAGPKATALFGLALVAGHNALDDVTFASPLWSILHRPGFVINTGDHAVFAAYPLVPWLGVTALGYALGGLYARPACVGGLRDGSPGSVSDEAAAWPRRGWLLAGSLAITAAFIVLRWTNVYGDPSPWGGQRTAVYTLLSFMNTTKYPPSLLFLLMTLGPVLLLLRASDGGVPRLLRPAIVIGRVPLFYYAVHFVLIHALAVIACLVRYGDAHWMFESPDVSRYPFTAPPGWGYPLPVVYGIWMAVVIALYPLCAWFGRVKRAHPDGWLRYV